MSRPVNKKCQHCATLSVDEAIALHGLAGDGCWNPGDALNRGYDCHRRRNHYRYRDDSNRTRRRLRKTGNGGRSQSTEPMELTVSLKSTARSAVLVLYRQGKDSPVHAIAAEVWQGDQKIAGVKPVHCMGMRGNEVTEYIQEMLGVINGQFDIKRFEDVIKEIAVHQCPINPCPLKA